MKVARGLAMLTFIVLLVVVLVISCEPSSKHPVYRPPGISPQEDPQLGVRTADADITPGRADPMIDRGAGTPGAFCATSRLGKYFMKGGIKYTCQGPKPYRWRKSK